MSTAGPSSTLVAVVGGGFAGIALGVKLRKAAIDDFVIFESSEGVGGTWWDNRYPGAEVDVASHLYSYSFKPYDWTRTHARQAELHRYLEDVVEEYGLHSRFRLSTKVERVEWSEPEQGYVLTTAAGDTHKARAVVSAVGLLNVPNYPQWPGLDEFAGPKIHTARWQAVDLEGKKVAVVGTGSTSAQVVPEVATQADHVTVFQREPGWVFPKPDRDFTVEEREKFRDPKVRSKERRRLFWQIEKGQLFGAIHRPGTKLNALREQQCRAYIAAVFKDRPDLAAAVTPAYPFPGKRPIQSKDFYPALLRPNVELVPHAVRSLTGSGIVDERGVEHPADVLIMATGFQPANFLASLEVVGPEGLSLRRYWNGDPQALLGITVPHFPNFFILYGPNTNGGEIVRHLERQAEFAVRSIKRLRRRGVARVEVRPAVYRLYNWWIQRAIAKTAWVESKNYYKSESGRVVTQWPYGSLVYGALTKLLHRPSEKVTGHRGSAGA